MQKQIKKLFSTIKHQKDPTMYLGNQIVHTFKLKSHHVTFRTFSLSEHIKILHDWCNQPYSDRFWGMRGSLKQLKAYYLKKIKSNQEVFLFIYFDEHPVAFTELYLIEGNILAEHYPAKKGDYGIHLLLAPYRTLIGQLENIKKDFAETVLSLILDYLFKTSEVERVVAEPDKQNINACRLAMRAGFDFIKEIKLPDKVASLFIYERNDFINKSFTKLIY